MPQIKNKKRKNNLLLMTLIIGGMFGASNLAHAADTTWTGGAGTSDWFTATNWGTEIVPTSSDVVYIGNTDGVLEITEAAVSSITNIGSDAGTVATLSISGETASLIHVGNLITGLSGTGTLLVSGGATVLNTFARIGNNEGSFGAVVITGAGSSWINSEFLNIGHYGTASLTISNGATVSDTYAFVGNKSSASASVLVTGSNSSWINSSYIIVGRASAGTLTISDGGYVSNTHSFVGDQSGATGSVTVTGSNSQWVCSSFLYIGNIGTGTLTVSNGGYVSANSFSFAASLNGYGSGLIDGVGSTLSVSGNLYIGNLGSASLTISNGGYVSSGGEGTIAAGTGTTATVIVTGSGSTLSYTDRFHVAAQGEAYLYILDGGLVKIGESLRIGNSIGGNGTIVVSGSGSRLIVTGYIRVALGWNGAATGYMEISNGGYVSDSYAYIGNSNGSEGAVLVTGEGSLWECSDYLRVGSGEATGVLTISYGGNVSVTNNVTLAYTATGSGTLNIGSASGADAVAPGTISAASLTFGSGTGTLVFNHTSTAYDFSLAMSGSGSILVESGFTTLTADSSSFTGTTTVSGGTLSVNGSLGGTITVTSGGRLQGIGTMSTVVIESGGVFAPGNSVGTTTVASLTLESGSSLEIEIDGTGSDVINVTGTLTNNGGDVVITMDEDVSLSTSSSYDYLTYASLSGSSVSVTVEDSLPFLSTTASSTGTTTSVAFSRNATSFASLAATDNQLKVASVLSGLSSGDLYQGLISVKNADLARSAYDQLSGALHANVKLSLLADNKDEIFASRLEEAPSPYVQALGQWTRRDGHSQTSGFSGNSRGILIGQERQIDKDKIFGFAVHYQKANYEEEANLYADATVKSYGASLYGQMPLKQYQAQLKAGLSYSYHDIESHREISISGYTDNPTGDYEAHKLETFIEAAKPYAWGSKGNIEPYGRLNLSYIAIPGFKESGGEAALDMQQSKDALGKTAIGLRFKGELPFLPRGDNKETTNKAIFKAHLGWEHIVGDLTTSSTGHLATLQDASISAAPLARDSVALGAQMQLHYGQSLNLGLRYAGTLAASSASHALIGNISARF